MRGTEIVFATSSKGKLKEARMLLKVMKVKNADIDFEEIQSLSVKDVARRKVLDAYAKVHKQVIVEDTGIYIVGLNGFPGALIKWLIKAVGYEGICRMVDRCVDRKVYAETCVAFYDGKKVRTFSGVVYGTIAMHPKGSRDFGWDFIFIPKGHKKTFAEMTIEEKGKMSMRGVAFRKLGRFLYSRS